MTENPASVPMHNHDEPQSGVMLSAPAAPEQPAPATPERALKSERPGVRATLNSLTGYDEIAIKRAFATPVSELDETMVVRAAYFILRKRGGDSDDVSTDAAMGATIGELKRYFSDAEDDETPATSGSTPEG